MLKLQKQYKYKKKFFSVKLHWNAKKVGDYTYLSLKHILLYYFRPFERDKFPNMVKKILGEYIKIIFTYSSNFIQFSKRIEIIVK